MPYPGTRPLQQFAKGDAVGAERVLPRRDHERRRHGSRLFAAHIEGRQGGIAPQRPVGAVFFCKRIQDEFGDARHAVFSAVVGDVQPRIVEHGARCTVVSASVPPALSPMTMRRGKRATTAR